MEEIMELIRHWVLLYCICAIIVCAIWGTVIALIAIHRGYEDQQTKWFWMGAFFGVIALAVIIGLPRRIKAAETPEPLREEPKGLSKGTWKCPCGTVNAGYISTCQCGRRKLDVLAEQRKAERGE